MADAVQVSHTTSSPREALELTRRILVDDEVYAITNRWRATRGLPPLKRDTRDAEVNAASAAGAGLGSGAGLAAELMQSAQPQPQA